MSKLYRLIKKLTVNVYARLTDYLYAAKWTALSIFSNKDPNAYRRPAARKPTVILISGVYESWYFMRPIAERIRGWGCDVRVIETLKYNGGEIDDAARMIHEFIRREDITRCVLVAHSKGGLIGKQLLANYNSDNVIRKLIAINTPFSGSKYAYLLPVKSLTVFRPGSQQLRSLALNKQINQRIVSVYSRFDPHIPAGSYLSGAKNIKLDEFGHFKIIGSQLLHSELKRQLLD